MPPENTLANIRVLVTRPAHQADRLARLIISRGWEAIRFPTVEILEPRDDAALFALIDRLHEFDMAIFISANAVDKGMDAIKSRRVALPAQLAIACVGPGGARQLERVGVVAPIIPKHRFDSEGLLALPELTQVHDRNILIFRGENGRALLGDTLKNRGARVAYAQCYRRAKPEADTTALLRRWSQRGIDIVVATSVDGLQNLFDMIGPNGHTWLINTPIVVIGQRMAQVAAELGLQHIHVAQQANDEAIVDAIKTWRGCQNSL